MNHAQRGKNGLACAALILTAATAIAQGPPPAAPFITHQLTPNVYWVEGGGGNSTVIVGTAGVVVVDAKTTRAGGQQLLDAIAKITPKPVTAVLLTHSDGDHVNGLAAFPAGIKIIAHENNQKEQAAALATGGPQAPPADHQPTQVVPDGKTRLTLEGQTLELFHWAPAHTSGDLVIFLPKDKIAATGDIIATNNPYPRIHDEKHGSSEGWLTTARGLVALDAAVYIPGHGNVVTKADIEKRIADAEARRTQVRTLAAQGKSLDEVKAAVGDTDKLTYKTWTEICYNEALAK